jgi:hypothetical protein
VQTGDGVKPCLLTRLSYNDRLNVDKFKAVVVTPRKEIHECPIVGISGVLVPEVGREELDKSLGGLLATPGDDHGYPRRCSFAK